MKHSSFRLGKIGLTALLTTVLVSFAGIFTEDGRVISASEGAESLFGSYLAGRFAKGHRDTEAAAKFYKQALERDPDNQLILEQAFFLEATAGNWERANKLALELVKRDSSHRFARTFLGAKAFREKNFERANKNFSTATRGPIAELTATLSRAWTYHAMGKNKAALKLLSKSDQADWVNFYKQYHRALIADLAGLNGVAEAAFSEIFQKDPRTLRVASIYARHLAIAGKMKQAEAILNQHIKRVGPRPDTEALLKMIQVGQVPPRLIKTPLEGLAEVYYGFGDALTAENGVDMGTVYLQLALYLRPDFPVASSSIAHAYEKMKKWDQAIAAYDNIPESDPNWSRIQIRKAFNLNSLEKVDEAKDLLVKIADLNPEDIRPLDALGDILRSHKRFDEAAEFYSRAIALIDKPSKDNWNLFYSRGVCYERMKDWPKAEKDLQKALSLDENQPLVLNYLGYSWVDQNSNLDEAMGLIRKAVRLKPDDGYFVDSLGWAHYRLGNYKAAAKELERAVELRPDDPVINDHLGDAYWQVGRRNEARFQWSQALTLEPEPEDAEKMKAKLENGLVDPKNVKTLSEKSQTPSSEKN